MKLKFAGILFTVAFAFTAQADRVTENQAAAVARSIVARGATLGEKLGSSVESIVRSTETNAHYFAVKMRGGGTVITSGDTELEPIVAILPGGEDFKDIPAEHPLRELLKRDLALRQRFLEERKRLPVVSMMSVNAAASTKQSRGKWETLLAEDEARSRPRLLSMFGFGGIIDADGEEDEPSYPPVTNPDEITDMRVEPLVEATWSQSGNGENLFTPNQSVCGCVATATAQIMHYHKWPTNEFATFKNTCSYNDERKEYESLPGPYDWEYMPGNNAGASDVQRRAIGKLTYNCGVAVGMMWTPRSSGASSLDIPDAYTKYLGYAHALQVVDYFGNMGLHTEASFEKYVFPCLDAGYPVQIGIADSHSQNGHSIVGDGYGYLDDGEAKIPYVHINMGWGANSGYNAWYNFPNVPYTATIDGGVTEYVIVTTLTYNILPETPKPGDGDAFILSGRMLDEEGAPLANAEVQIEKGGTVVNVVTSNVHGVWGAALGSRGNYTVFGITEDKLSGEISVPNLSDNSWGHDMVLACPSVENTRTLEQYSALDRAIEKAEYGDTLEVFTQSVFKATCKLHRKLTIRGREGVDPALRRVVVSPGVRLDVVVGGDLTLKDLDFTRSENNFDERSLCSEVMANRTLSISNVNGLEEITICDVNSLTVAGPVTNPIYIVSRDIPCGENDKFAKYSTPEAGACANFFFNAGDDELGGFAVEDDGSLVWSYEATVPDAGADVKLFADGTKTNYRTFSALLRHRSGDAEIEVAKRGVKLEESVAVANHLAIFASSPEKSIDALPGTEFQVADGGELIVSNVVIDAQKAGKTLFKVTGGKLTLENGTEVCKLSIPATKADIYNDAGVVLMTGGEVTLRPGATIRDCSTGGNGGAIYAQGGLLALEGGLIQNCSAGGMFGGGAICAFMSDARVTVSGGPVISDNIWFTKGKKETDNLHLYDGPLEVNGELAVSSRVGVRTDDMNVGGVFAVAIDETAYATPEAKAFATHAFINDVHPELVADWNPAEGHTDELVWIENPNPGEVPVGLEYLATAQVIAENCTNLYFNLSDALRYMQSAGTVELLTNSVPLVGNTTLPYSAMIRTMAGTNEVFAVNHDGDASGTLIVPAGVELTLTNVNFACNSTIPVHQHAFEVNGGKLTLEAGATISGYVSAENSTRAASAIVVWNDGTFTMKDGAVIHSCRNQHIVPGDANSGAGGAVLIDGKGAKGVFLGGIITNCYAKIGGGVEVCNEATAYVSGNLLIAANRDRDATDVESRSSDFVVEDKSKLYLDGPLADAASIGRLAGFRANSNLVAYVENWADKWESDEALATDAAKFFNDEDSSVKGAVVTNETATALVVWFSALDENGCYTLVDENQKTQVYGLLALPPQPEPAAWEVVTNYPTPIAFKSVTRLSETEWALVITDRVEFCNYRLLLTDDLAKGFTVTGDWEQAHSSGAWTTNVITSGGTWFWGAEGAEGTNMVHHLEK